MRQIFGPQELAARGASVIAGAVTVAILYSIVREWLGERTARLAALVLATQPLFFAASQFANLDMLVASCISACILSGANSAIRREAGLVYSSLAAVVVPESVGHRAIETGELPHSDDRHLQKLLDGSLILQPTHRTTRPHRKRTGNLVARRARLEFDDCQARVSVGDEIEEATFQTQLACKALFVQILRIKRFLNRVAHRGVCVQQRSGVFGAEFRRSGTEQRTRIRTDMTEHAVLVERAQRAVGLNEPWNVDWFACAVVECGRACVGIDVRSAHSRSRIAQPIAIMGDS